MTAASSPNRAYLLNASNVSGDVFDRDGVFNC
jgi:hypothetical protein